MLDLFCTHSARQYPSALIWRTGQPLITNSISVIDACNIVVIITGTRNSLRISINTFKWCAIMTIKGSCQVAIVLPGPWQRALCFSRNHENWCPGRSEADSTWYVVILEIWIWCLHLCIEFTLSTPHSAQAWDSCCVSKIVRIFR